VIIRPYDYVRAIEAAQIDLSTEKAAQASIASAIAGVSPSLEREVRLSAESIIDFFGEGLGIEVKISGSPMAIFAQIERYAAFDEVQWIILATSRAMRLPPLVKAKPAFVASLGRGWL